METEMENVKLKKRNRVSLALKDGKGVFLGAFRNKKGGKHTEPQPLEPPVHLNEQNAVSEIESEGNKDKNDERGIPPHDAQIPSTSRSVLKETESTVSTRYPDLHPEDAEELELYSVKEGTTFPQVLKMFKSIKKSYRQKLVENRDLKEENKDLLDELEEKDVALRCTEHAMQNSIRDNERRRKEIRAFQKILQHEDFANYASDELFCLCLYEYVTNEQSYEDRERALWFCRYCHKDDADYGLWCLETEVYFWKKESCWALVLVKRNKPLPHNCVAMHVKRMIEFKKNNAKEFIKGGKYFHLLRIEEE